MSSIDLIKIFRLVELAVMTQRSRELMYCTCVTQKINLLAV
jgi:hypothetical protein